MPPPAVIPTGPHRQEPRLTDRLRKAAPSERRTLFVSHIQGEAAAILGRLSERLRPIRAKVCSISASIR